MKLKETITKEGNKRLLIDVLKLTLGCTLYVAGYNMIASQHNYVPSGAYGITLLLHNKINMIPKSVIYLLVNIPLFVIAKWHVSLKFFILNLYSMILITILIALFQYQIPINDTVLAAVAAGAVMGTGLGIVYTTSGGSGGFDVITIIANMKYGIKIGSLSFVINAIIMSFAATQVSPDKLVASILMIFIMSMTSENTLSSYNTRKEMKIITGNPKLIIEKLVNANIRATLVNAHGMYSNKEKTVIILITNNFQMKNIENIVMDIDPEAIVIVGNTFNVIGKFISPRKKY